MTIEDIKNVEHQGNKTSACFMWATGPKLDLAVETMKAWDYHYRGVAFVWVKTRQDGEIIHAQGVPPTATKPTTEFVLLGTSCKRGRPFPLLSSRVPQVILAPRGAHSAKPSIIRDHIISLYGDRSRVELFAREEVDGWVARGLETSGEKL